MVQAQQLRQHERREHALALAQLECRACAGRRRRSGATGRCSRGSPTRWSGHRPRHPGVPVREPERRGAARAPAEAPDRRRRPVALLAAPGGSRALPRRGGSAHAGQRRRDPAAPLRAGRRQRGVVRAALRLLPSEEAADRLELRGFSVEITEGAQARAALELLARAFAEALQHARGRRGGGAGRRHGLGLVDGAGGGLARRAGGRRAAAHARADRRAASSAPRRRRAVARCAAPPARGDGRPGRAARGGRAPRAGPALERPRRPGSSTCRSWRGRSAGTPCSSRRAPARRGARPRGGGGARPASPRRWRRSALRRGARGGPAPRAVPVHRLATSSGRRSPRCPLRGRACSTRRWAGARIPVPESSKQELMRRIRTRCGRWSGEVRW